MEYTFQNSPSDKPGTITLDEFNLILRSSGQESVFPYSKIIDVQLDRTERRFKTLLSIEGGKTLTITNRSFTENKRPEDQSRAYATFVRILHFHLKDKSPAVFFSGSSKTKIGGYTVTAILLSFIVSFTAEYFEIGLVNPFIQAVVLAAMIGVVILALNIGKWPKSYVPTDIPLEFLP